jgi:hypothetical protein
MYRFSLVLFMVIGLWNYQSSAQETTEFFDNVDDFLSRNVKNGKVDYRSIHTDPTALNELIALASQIEVSATKSREYQAYWINAYNISVIKGIIDNYPIKSPLDVQGFFDKTQYNLAGRNITLNDIENKLLRDKFKDARFHFVLVCGAKGCPPIISKAYTSDNLEVLLKQQTIKALNNSSFIRVSEGEVALSEIFKWYREDFVKNGQSEIDFLNIYRKEKINDNSKITYYPYDWRLNTQ